MSSPYLVAMLDCYDQVAETSKADNVSAALSGAFQNSDGAVYVLGSDSVNENMVFSQNPSAGTTTVTVNGVRPAIHRRGIALCSTGSGNDTIDASGVNLPLTAYAGSGTDTIIGGARQQRDLRRVGHRHPRRRHGPEQLDSGRLAARPRLPAARQDDWLYAGSAARPRLSAAAEPRSFTAARAPNTSSAVPAWTISTADRARTLSTATERMIFSTAAVAETSSSRIPAAAWAASRSKT